MADSYKSTCPVSPRRTPDDSQISSGSLKYYQKPRKTVNASPTALFHLADKKSRIDANFLAKNIQSFGVSSNKKRFISSIDQDSISFGVSRTRASKQKISEEKGKDAWVSQTYFPKSRFKDDLRRGENSAYSKQLDSSGKGRKIKEEALGTGKSGLSVKSNLSYILGCSGSNLGFSTKSRQEYFFNREMIHKKGSRKVATQQLEIGGLSSTVKDFYSNQKFVSKVTQNRKTKPISQRLKELPVRRRIRNLVGIKTIENFGGIANFCLKKKDVAHSKFPTKKQSRLKTPNKCSRKMKYRNYKADLTSSEEMRGSSSVKARQAPRVWFPNQQRHYYSKKSCIFDQLEKSRGAGVGEREVVRMFLQGSQRGQVSKLSREKNSLILKIQEKCRKIVQEPKSSVASRVKLSKSANERKGFEMKSVGGRSFQTPPITSIDPLYIQAFMVKKKKRSKLKKGLLFFIARFKSKRMEKSFYVYENESKVIKFKRNQKNKIIEHTADDDYDTDDEQMKLAVRQCKKDFLQALKKAKAQVRKKKRAMSMVNLAKKKRTGGLIGEHMLKLRQFHEKSKKRDYHKKASASRRQTRKNHVGAYRKGESIRSVASTVASSRSTHKPKPGEERGRKMIRNEFYNADKIKRRAISIVPKRSCQKRQFYQFFEKGCRKRNKVGF